MSSIICWRTEGLKALVLLAEVERGQVLQLQLCPPIAPPTPLPAGPNMKVELPVPPVSCWKTGRLANDFFQGKSTRRNILEKQPPTFHLSKDG